LETIVIQVRKRGTIDEVLKTTVHRLLHGTFPASARSLDKTGRGS